ncbi:MAG: hypothetical protein AAFX80_04180 [Cyanobacteria bacterium J06639_18]
MESDDSTTPENEHRPLTGNQTSRDQLRQAQHHLERFRSNVQATATANGNISRTLDEIEQRWARERVNAQRETESIREEPGIDNSRDSEYQQTDRESPEIPEPDQENFKRPRRGLGR